MRRFLFLFTLLLTGLGCTPPMDQQIAPLSTLPNIGQTASTVMLIGYGHTGGMGTMPILNDMGELQTINELPVYFDELYLNQVAEKLPACYEGTPLITVRATVQIEERREINTSIPDAPEENFLVAVVKNLDSIDVKTQPCAE